MDLNNLTKYLLCRALSAHPSARGQSRAAPAGDASPRIRASPPPRRRGRSCSQCPAFAMQAQIGTTAPSAVWRMSTGHMFSASHVGKALHNNRKMAMTFTQPSSIFQASRLSHDLRGRALGAMAQGSKARRHRRRGRMLT